MYMQQWINFPLLIFPPKFASLSLTKSVSLPSLINGVQCHIVIFIIVPQESRR